jgi:hypothetical protein
MKFDASSSVLFLYLAIISGTAVTMMCDGCDSCGCTLDTRPTLHPVDPPPPPKPPTRDEDAGDDAGVSARDREWRELITPQPVRTAPRDHCQRPAYRDKRECRSQSRVRRRQALHHMVGC